MVQKKSLEGMTKYENILEGIPQYEKKKNLEGMPQYEKKKNLEGMPQYEKKKNL